MADLITDTHPPDAIRPFDPTRFETGDAIAEPTIIGAAESENQPISMAT